MARGPIRAVLVSLAVVVLAGALLASGYVVLRYAPNWFGHPDTKLTTAQATERGDARTAALAFLAGLVAASGALFTRVRQFGPGSGRSLIQSNA
jgi:hypothetical protein